MTPDPNESHMDSLNRLNAEHFPGVFVGGAGLPSYWYWRLAKGAARNRYETYFAYGTTRSLGPNGRQPVGWWSWTWVFKEGGRVGHVERAVRSATRRKAKARAYRLYLTARGIKPQPEPAPAPEITAPAAPTPPAPADGPGRAGA